MRYVLRLILLSALLTWLIACAPLTPQPQPGQAKLRVVATTTIVGDVVANVAGDAIELSVLLPSGADPHLFNPTPQDVAKVSQADLVFANGAGLEAFLDGLLESAGAKEKTFAVSEGIQLLESASHAHEEAHSQEGEHSHEAEHGHEGEHAHRHGEGDPHVWLDPNLVKVWVQNIARVLSEKDPQNASLYQRNAEAYTAQLDELDRWIRQEVEKIPAENRLLVTDHLMFGYFAQRYGFTQVGAVLPGFSTLAEPSAQELAQLEDTIRQYGIKAVFVSKAVNPDLAQRVAEDTGVKLVFLHAHSLDQSSPANTYLNLMRYNVSAIVEALK
ncbi:MAG: metal ABC transporter substrate-binding protein [Anaerolineales bacterium]|nr:metal ABC transporter substrate-binding protein [Anaerolineales bacterium]MCS7249234.1 metal ABC transporter substrate-binding protein [Anaerolineales bacterium]MDW8163048.1 metal ABC transporter substrate-binding protein [Anaerolineales bacterium]MDW8445672.1 metal ABC transporter substrate-binding protein [Anaerolineales bacterium]